MTAPPVDLATVLRRIELVSRSWPGEKLDPGGCIRGVGLVGGMTPIFWTFNTAAELPALAAHLPEGQPIVGTRSLNEIVEKPTRESTRIVAEVAEFYARHLIARFGTGSCLLGGNCQAAEVAWHIAGHLIAAGVDLRGFITLDADWQLPLPVPVRMIFGQTSRFNPTLGTSGALQRRQTNWRALFPAYDLRVIPGNHGEYFQPENVAALARQILDPMPQARPGPPPAISQDWRLRRDRQGWVLTLPARQMPEAVEGIVLAPLLGRKAALPLARPDLFDFASLPERSGRHWRVRLGPLADPGPWQITPLLCAPGIGPLNWPLRPQVLSPADDTTRTPANRRGWRVWYHALQIRISLWRSRFADLRRRSRRTAPEHQDFREIQFREDR